MILRKYYMFYPFLIFVMLTRFLPAQEDTSLIQVERKQLDYTHISPPKTQAETEVVGASRSAKKLEDLPVTVEVVERDEILRNGYTTLVDVLKSRPGIRVSQPGSDEDGQTFIMRGLLGNYYTKILINNIPIAPSVNGSTSIAAQIPVRQAERIEIIYGPASAVYGADATTGVINIITKKAEGNYFAQGDVSTGQYGYSYFDFMIGGKAGKNKNILQYNIYGIKSNTRHLNIYHDESEVYNPLTYFSVNQEITEDDLQFLNYLGVDDIMELDEDYLRNVGINPDTIKYILLPHDYVGTLTEPEKANLPKASHAVGFEFNFRGFRLMYENTYRRCHSSIGRTTYLFRYNNPNNLWGQYTQRYSLSYEKAGKKLSSVTNLSYLQYRLDNRSTRAVNYIENAGVNQVYVYSASDDIFAEQLFTYQPNERFEIVTGLSYQYSGCLPQTNELWSIFDKDAYKPFSTKSLPEHDYYGDFGLNPIIFHNAGSFVQLYAGFKKWTLIGGVRYDYNSEYGSSFNPRIAALYKINEKNAVRISTGNAYKAPPPNRTYYSVGFPGPMNSVVYAFIPNEDLEPEKFNSSEMGYRHKFNDKVSLDIALYGYEIENLISIIFTELDSSTYTNASPIPYTQTRMCANSKGSYSELRGTQILLKMNDIFPAIHLSSNICLNINQGSEVLASDSTVRIDEFRMLPALMLQADVSFYPAKNLYINATNIAMSSWYRGHIPNESAFENPYSKVDGYYTLDVLARYNINEYFSVFLNVNNVFDAEYGGIDATQMDTDLKYNPQKGRNVRFGLSFSMQ